jgi:hypothetical protein
MTDWEVGVVTQSNYFKKVRVNDCVTRSDAEEAALGMTGGKRVTYSTPKTYNDDVESNTSSGGGVGSNISFGGLVWLIGICLVIAYWQYVLAISVVCGLVWFFFLRDK